MESIISYFGTYKPAADGAVASFKFEYLCTLGFAAIVIFLGRAIVARSEALRKYAIPAPVISGLIFSIIVSCIKGAGIVGISFDATIMKDLCQNLFFLCVGFGFSAKMLRHAGGKLCVMIAFAACLLITCQDVLGVAIAHLINLNPHFLYNTLDTMKWVAKANHIPEIATLAAKLAKILRTSISSAQFITLQEEMTLVESYAKIQKIRFNGKFDFRYEIAPETEEILVPKLIVQPIVENAVIHGLADADEGHIFVRAYLERKELVIEVSDDGCGISDEVIRRLGNRDKEQKNGHIGFYNVDTIIRLHYGKDYGLRAERLAAGGTKVTIRIPVNGSGQPAPSMENRS